MTNNNQVRYLDIDQELGYEDFFVCLHAFGDKGTVREEVTF